MGTLTASQGHSYWRVLNDPQRRSLRRRIGERLLKALIQGAPTLSQIAPLRRAVFRAYERSLRRNSQAAVRAGACPAGVEADRLAMALAILSTVERALAERRVGDSTLRALLNTLVRDVLIGQGDQTPKAKFSARYQSTPPSLLLISPTKSCNLRCTGCYADSGASSEKLRWPVFVRLVREAHDLWGARFFVLSGGEPFTYRDQGKGVLDLAEEFPDSFFMAYTNGTLLSDEVVARLRRCGNLMPAISVEGLREATDERRGAGVFEQISAAMERLRRAQVFFGISLTALRSNADTLLSDEVIDYYFERMGASFAWIFHYMPIGRAFTLDLMPTPEQRLRLWERTWELVRERRLMIADFWDSGVAADGCISAGRPGGYMAVDWNGAVLPCVFAPYSPANINTLYAQGKTLNEAWADPFFASIRQWQADYGYQGYGIAGTDCGNRLMPCPIRDHHADFVKLLHEHEPDPADENARAAMLDPEYHRGLEQYDEALSALLDPIWRTRYLGQEAVAERGKS